MNFKELNIKEEIKKVINELGYETPTPIQKEIIPYILDGFDVLGRSETGTGKTLAFASSLLSKIDLSNKGVKALIIAPTRELAIQVEEEVNLLGKHLKVSTLCVYGSSSIENQISKLKKRVDVVVGTPGRILDLIKRRVLDLSNIDFFVLDEADEMLNMGFKEDIESIFNSAKEKKQVLLFSATMPKQILSMAKTFMRSNYKEVSVISNEKTSKNIEQKYYIINDKERIESMCRLMDFYSKERCIIFCKTKKSADAVQNILSLRGYSIETIHGDIAQNARIKTLERFKNKAFNYLIATDVAARGIHVDDVELIINYNLPQDNETYVHRIGRTGRAGNKGLAITLVSPKEEKIIFSIERHIGKKIDIDKLPTEEEILTNKFNQMISEVKKIDSKHKLTYFEEYLNSLDHDELKNICSSLLEEQFISKFGSNFRVDVSVSKNNKNKDRNSNNGTRVFLTIGKLDKIDRKTLLTELERISGLPFGTIFNVEIMTKFTFLSVDNKYIDTFVSKCNKCRINGRVINVEKAKK